MFPNLRSRGDGPADEFFIRRRDFKPPLTRRWTILPCLMLNTFSQTSAHAEMDLLDTTYTDLYRPNLRSRGDGPAVIVQHSADHGKPPLTRRWTYRALPSGRARFQTSAHAEMDPLPESWHFKDAPNLRSRGDGPRAGDTDQNLQTKPPLTRRWTQAPFARAFFILQTSAHAEMDPTAAFVPGAPVANLRSRGDGPLTYYVANADAVKPPLTRRWTNKPGLSITYMGQTSAHAEMDPTTRRTTPTVFPNLRSRGDGPALLAFGALRSGKPPLTRG